MEAKLNKEFRCAVDGNRPMTYPAGAKVEGMVARWALLDEDDKRASPTDDEAKELVRLRKAEDAEVPPRKPELRP